MNNSQKNKLSMYLAVLGVMGSYESVWMQLAGIAALVSQLTDLVDEIQRKSGVQGTPRDGIAKGKNRKQVAMIILAAEVAGDLHAYAVKQKDDVLAGQTNVEISDLIGIADGLIAARCREIHDLGAVHAAAIAPLGTTAADLSALEDAIVAYEPLATAPRQATVTGKGVTSNIAADIRSADALLRSELDKAMRKFKRKNPEFALAYTNARIIVDLGGGHHPGDDTGPPPTPKPPTP